MKATLNIIILSTNLNIEEHWIKMYYINIYSPLKTAETHHIRLLNHVIKLTVQINFLFKNRSILAACSWTAEGHLFYNERAS